MPSEYRLVAIEAHESDDSPISLHKVFTNADGSLRAHVPFAMMEGSSVEDLKLELGLMLHACDCPIIGEDEFPASLPTVDGIRGSFTLGLKSHAIQDRPSPDRRTPELRIIPKSKGDLCVD